MRIFLIILGSVSLALGLLGVLLPVLPTTPFLLLSAAVWVKASSRLYEWLLNHKLFGEYIRNFREHKAIPLHAKIISVVLLWATMSYCIFVIASDKLWLQIVLVTLATAVTWHILSYATLRKR
jgi:uncharacterized membrane protein YbaN (DUF454 family)